MSPTLLVFLVACAGDGAKSGDDSGVTAGADDGAADSGGGDSGGGGEDSGGEGGDDTEDSGDIVSVTGLTIADSELGTLRVSWECYEGQTLSIAGPGGDVRTVAAEGCPRELEVSAAPGEVLGFEVTDAGGSVIAEAEADLEPLPGGVFQVGDGLEIEGEPLIEEGVLAFGYEFGNGSGHDEEWWGDGVLVLLAPDGHHLAHIHTATEPLRAHKSVFLDVSAGVLSYTDYSTEFSEDAMADNRVGRWTLGGPDAGLSYLPSPQGHHFHHPDSEGVLAVQAERYCDYGGSGEVLNADRVVRIDPTTGENEVIFDSMDEWIPGLEAELGTQEMLDQVRGNFEAHDCDGVSMTVNDVTHMNNARCLEGSDFCLTTVVALRTSMLIFRRSDGVLLHDLSTFSFAPLTDSEAGIPLPPPDDGFPIHHDARFLSEDELLVYFNGADETGSYVSRLEVTWPERPGLPGVLREVWTTRRTEGCVQGDYMGWVNPTGDGFLVSYGTGGVVTREDAEGEEAGRMMFEINDNHLNGCGNHYQADIFSGEARHLTEADLQAAFPDWIRF